MPKAKKRATGTSLEDSQSAAGVSELAIDITNGSIECSAAEIPAGTVQVDWRITEAKGPGIKAKIEELQIVLKQEGGKLLVHDDYTGSQLARRPELKLWLRVHKDIPVGLKAGNGSINLSAPLLSGVNMGNGSLKLDGALVQDAGISLGNGDIDGKLLIAAGRHSVTLGNGRIDLSLAPGSSCAVTATTAVGQIDAQGFTVQRNWHLTGGTVTGSIGAGQGTLSLNVGNGQISLEAPATRAGAASE